MSVILFCVRSNFRNLHACSTKNTQTQNENSFACLHIAFIQLKFAYIYLRPLFLHKDFQRQYNVLGDFYIILFNTIIRTNYFQADTTQRKTQFWSRLESIKINYFFLWTYLIFVWCRIYVGTSWFSLQYSTVSHRVSCTAWHLLTN